MKQLKYLVLVLLCAAALSVRGYAAFGPQNLTIPDRAGAIVYGQSGAGRNLMAYRFGSGDNVMVLGFAIHGFEDNWSRDGEALVYTAGQVMKQLDEHIDVVEDWGWSVYVLPCLNPDGLLDGWTNNGPGRCTTTYYKNGNLVNSWGVDMNRSFPARWSQYTSGRNWNGSAPLACKEAAALAQFVQDVKGSGANLCIDTHGWMSQIITSNGYSALYNVFKARFPGNTYANCNNGRGYFTAYTASLGYASCLFEFPDGLYGLSAFQQSGYCEKYVDCIMELLTKYGTYDPHSAICPSGNFWDVGRTAWYHSAVDYTVERGIFRGISEHSFAPELEITRAMLVTTLWRLEGEPETAVPAQDPASEESELAEAAAFSDVPEDTWFTQAIYWARENGIVLGYPDGTFRPNDQLFRQDLVVFLQRYAAYQGRDTSQRAELAKYTDTAQIGQYAVDAMSWGCATGLIQGMSESTISPLGTATRAQTAAILMRYCGGEATVQVTAATPQIAQEPNIDADGEDLDGN